MVRFFANSLLGFFAFSIAFFHPSPSFAYEGAERNFAPACIAFEDKSQRFDVTAQEGDNPINWQCESKSWKASSDAVWLKFDRDLWAGKERPQFFFSRIARFQSISFTALDTNGAMRTAHYSEKDGKAFAAGPVFQLTLPKVTPETRTVLVRIERPHSIPLLSEARLSSQSEAGDWTQLEVVLLAFVVGMLILPLMFDISFYIVLREKFVVLHALMVISMIGYVLFAGGLISVFATLPLAVMAVATPMTWTLTTALAAFFLAEFLEPGVQSRKMKRWTIGAAIFTLLLAGLCSLQLGSMHPWDDRLYFAAFVPAIVMYCIAITSAIRNGSCAARFTAAAWLPILCAAIERMMRGLGAYEAPSTFDQAIYIAAGFEVIVMSLAIASRFLRLKRERDDAVAEAEMLGELSERDPLTGLLNRRAVAARFETLHAAGFHTFALVDLDHFKQVNDVNGHKVGDDVLVAVGDALRGNNQRNAIAVRMGGEEFVVLMRGSNALRRIEALRQSLPRRIATAVPGLEKPVTASMGVIVVAKMGGNVKSFDDLYARADAIMYQAKESGRNRMCYEKLTVFNTAPPQRRSVRIAA